ncbi:hypothetical protein PR003_g29359 [Phytophthora rubi]|uniref:Uncharacterized protein n=1 Tax=Phytophthora rubi TaxID=129364 RepID=A0A6A3HBW7_9STRA|nr:hypothetical protein PR002_g28265 [Phytophthora rubi]KAE8967085.1 hypothetical protein PR001_g28203 [Phytophthora rubi]KAE9275348.1 hypothetical protein PR003_g29359 [Phytophthora rubi]
MAPAKVHLLGTFFLLAAAVLPASATDLWLYDHDDYDKHKKFKRFNFGTSQRCYSIANCFNDKASSVSWINAPSDSWIVFYDDAECSGTQYVSTSPPSGEIKFAPVNLDNKVSSFMLWEYGTFALNGFVDICEAAILRSANTSANSSSLDSGSKSSNGSITFE